MRYALNEVAINGNQTIKGSGVASIVVSASGFTTKQKNGTSTAALSSMQASAISIFAKSSQSNANILVLADGGMKKATPAYSDAVVTQLTAHHGIPNPKITPDIQLPSHESRIIIVRAEFRDVGVNAESTYT